MTEPDLTFTRLAGTPDSPLLVVGPSLGTAVDALWETSASLLGNTFEVVGWDLPGHGRSKPAADEFTLAELAAVVRRTASELVASDSAPGGRRAVYAGVSMGGAVALQLALEPGPFAATACVAGGSKLGEPESWRERAALVRRAGTPVMVSGSAERWFAPGFLDREPATANRLLLSLSEADKDSYALCCEALAAFDLGSRLAEARIPVLVLPGEHDQVVTAAAAREVAAGLPGARFEVAARCGHLPPAERPRHVAHLLRSHLTEENRSERTDD